ncbi:PQQ-binding-like beta-propeller repeat protein [Kitasatospora sp. NPDC092286]|uniref:outer membrane protein assembly factor BamB family protein n=1 Tax=Kitasatospora sp. NPDC092286 TaxID=3364087 RepID=UPI0037F9B0AB
MQPAASERSATQASDPAEDTSGASWQWDEEADDRAAAPADVVGGGAGPDGDGPRPSRRRLLAGAGVLAAGAALWAVSRPSGGGPAPGPPRPLPTRIAGPEPLWTYRGPAAMTPERLADHPDRPLFLSRTGLQVLDPADGSPLRGLVFETPGKDRPGDLGTPADRVVLGADRMFTVSYGHIDGRHLTDAAADWSLPLPDHLDGSITLYGCDGATLYGKVSARPAGGALGGDTLFAVRIADRTVLWSRPVAPAEQLFTPVTAAGGRLPACDTTAGRTALVVRGAADGERAWSAAADENLRWCAADQENLYLPDGPAGLRALRLADGSARWETAADPAGELRSLSPVTDGTRVYLPRDNGLVTAYDAATGAELWSRRLPFRLDRRSHPLPVGGVLFVPGPAAAGVCALDAATGTELWTFRDSGPGVDVWSLAADRTRLYAGHDDILYALPLT